MNRHESVFPQSNALPKNAAIQQKAKMMVIFSFILADSTPTLSIFVNAVNETCLQRLVGNFPH